MRVQWLVDPGYHPDRLQCLVIVSIANGRQLHAVSLQDPHALIAELRDILFSVFLSLPDANPPAINQLIVGKVEGLCVGIAQPGVHLEHEQISCSGHHRPCHGVYTLYGKLIMERCK